ncbi:hypothetical protein GCM10010182_01020 [Actinomadura cremea]|nr:hypothetical protein GCM10010182_01020 [Actinomadura cremea]
MAVSRQALAWWRAMRALEDRARGSRARAGLPASRRQAAAELGRDPYRVQISGQWISEWLPRDPERMQVPRHGDAGIEASVWALIRLWSAWAGDRVPDRRSWMQILEDAQPQRTGRTASLGGTPTPGNASCGEPVSGSGAGTVPVVYLPYRAEETFVGRAEELARLDAVFGDGADTVVVPSRSRSSAVGAVHGLGGIGKSTLAAY